MNQAQFKVLDMTIPSGDFRYHDEGHVGSVVDAARELYQRSGIEAPCVPGKATGFYAGMGLDIHVLYAKGLTVPRDIQNRAHEETHAVDYIGGLDFLSEKMLEQGVRINFKGVDDEEVRAQLGSLYALSKRGISVRQLGPYKRDVRLQKAIEIWRCAEFPKRKWFQFFQFP